MISDSGRFEMTPFAFTVDNLLMIFNSILQAPNNLKRSDLTGVENNIRLGKKLTFHVIPKILKIP